MDTNTNINTSTNTSKRRYTPEQLARKAAYMRSYRVSHPGCEQRWHQSYILRKAARLQAEAEARGAADRGGD